MGQKIKAQAFCVACFLYCHHHARRGTLESFECLALKHNNGRSEWNRKTIKKLSDNYFSSDVFRAALCILIGSGHVDKQIITDLNSVLLSITKSSD